MHLKHIDRATPSDLTCPNDGCGSVAPRLILPGLDDFRLNVSESGLQLLVLLLETHNFLLLVLEVELEGLL
jgi:hypothetical protein